MQNQQIFQVDGTPVYAMHDVPHILKNIRNTLKKHDVKFGDGQVICFNLFTPFIIIFLMFS